MTFRGWPVRRIFNRGSLICGVRGGAIARVTGKSGGYYGCIGATRRKCENRLLVRRTLAERIILAAIREKLASRENLVYVLKRVEKELAKVNSEAPEGIRLKEADLAGEERRVANFVEFIGDGGQPRSRMRFLLLSSGAMS